MDANRIAEERGKRALRLATWRAERLREFLCEFYGYEGNGDLTTAMLDVVLDGFRLASPGNDLELKRVCDVAWNLAEFEAADTDKSPHEGQ